MKFSILGALPLAALVACAAPNPAPAPQVADGKPVVCERDEARTGTMLGRKQCGPATDTTDRVRLNADLQNQIRPSASNPGQGGGH